METDTFKCGAVLRNYPDDNTAQAACTCESIPYKPYYPVSPEEIEAVLNRLGKIIYYVEYIFTNREPVRLKLTVNNNASRTDIMLAAIELYMFSAPTIPELRTIIMQPIYQLNEKTISYDLTGSNIVNVLNTINADAAI